MTFKTRSAVGYAVAALGFAAALGAAQAQEPTPAPANPAPMQAPTVEAPDVSDEKLKSFAVAFLEVSKISQEYKPEFDGAASEEDKQRVQQEAGQKMVEAVNATEGISIDEYNQIIQSAQADPELAQRINGHISQAAGQAAPAAPAQPADQ